MESGHHEDAHVHEAHPESAQIVALFVITLGTLSALTERARYHSVFKDRRARPGQTAVFIVVPDLCQ